MLNKKYATKNFIRFLFDFIFLKVPANLLNPPLTYKITLEKKELGLPAIELMFEGKSFKNKNDGIENTIKNTPVIIYISLILNKFSALNPPLVKG